MTIKNDGADLKRGDRIALLLAIDGQDSAVLVDEAWVGEASKASVVTYVLPYQVEIIKTAKQFGTLSIVGLPESARNIYEGRAVKSAADLLAQIKNITGQSTMVAANSTKSSRRFPSYAWIRGAGIRYGIESNGDMYIVDSTGKEAIAPLMPKME